MKGLRDEANGNREDGSKIGLERATDESNVVGTGRQQGDLNKRDFHTSESGYDTLFGNRQLRLEDFNRNAFFLEIFAKRMFPKLWQSAAFHFQDARRARIKARQIGENSHAMLIDKMKLELSLMRSAVPGHVCRIR